MKSASKFQKVTNSTSIDILRRKQTGMGAWLMHRITGVGIAFYLLLHIGVIATLIIRGQQNFDSALKVLMHSPVFVFLDFLLLLAVLVHGLNGIRLILFDMGFFITKQKQVFWVMLGIAVGIFVWAVYRILRLG